MIIRLGGGGVRIKKYALFVVASFYSDIEMSHNQRFQFGKHYRNIPE